MSRKGFEIGDGKARRIGDMRGRANENQGHSFGQSNSPLSLPFHLSPIRKRKTTSFSAKYSGALGCSRPEHGKTSELTMMLAVADAMTSYTGLTSPLLSVDEHGG
jgi:hypothetical protein